MDYENIVNLPKDQLKEIEEKLENLFGKEFYKDSKYQDILEMIDEAWGNGYEAGYERF